MFLFCVGESGESVFGFGDDEDVDGGDGGDVSEGEHLFVFVDDVGGDFLADEFVENGLFCHWIRN